MSIKVVQTLVPISFPMEGDRPYIATKAYGWSAICIIDGWRGLLTFDVSEGYISDGCSFQVPLLRNPPIRHWWGQPKMDCAALGHDILYMLEGRVNGLGRSLSVSECDDYIRGAWREGGMPRGWAGVADVCLNVAHTRRHWGSDGYNVRDKVKVNWVRLSWVGR